MPDSIRSSAWSIKIPASVGLSALVILVLGLGLWSVQTELAGAIIAPGVIEVQSNRQVVEHPDGGVVGEIYVRDGDAVLKGDLLLRLDETFLASEKNIVESQLFELLARMTRLEIEREGFEAADLEERLRDLGTRERITPDILAGQERLFVARLNTLEQKFEQLEKQKVQLWNQIEGIQAQLVSSRTQVILIQNELEDQESLLTRGLTQASRVSALQREEAHLLGEIGRLESSIAGLQGEISSTDIQIIELGATRREEAITQLRDVQARIVELAERRLSLNERLSRLDIRAPVTGMVYDSQVFALQSVVQPGEPMLYIVPQDTPLLVAAKVDSLHVDQLHRGQEVSLRFPTFNQRETPELNGYVINVSADTFEDENTGYTYYRAEVIPNDGELDLLNGQKLLPGMPVEAMIKTDERTPLSYLVKPMADYFYRAFRG
ncbi:HlyD family type I secretion periplasmic adaptor subunit [uncultured Ruegeria sp.]|uniref:HlyD family type I secretion periplasmic adaptor subunit n=1 Tax=uncultured Ruegeria sp. TaxID=259304 RepID=UPI00262A360E|nr:HlyD family type I secretion periplasmic adaptor subunit [uncultured Ruegeria sp.]